MATDLSLRILVGATDQASDVVSNIAGNIVGKLSGVNPALGLVAGGMMAIVGGSIAVGVASVKMAGDFEQATNQLITSAGESRTNIDMVRQGILGLSVSTATSWQQLTAGMFNVESAGYRGAAALGVLKAAAQGARAENADLASTTDVLTTAMHNYHVPASQAVSVMDSLIVTVANGKMHMNDLTGALRNVLPVASAFHIKLSDVEGALSTMAMSGDKGTAAGTHLAMMFKMLANPTGTAAKEMRAMGIDSIKLAQEMQVSLPGALQMIQRAVGEHFVPGSVQYQRAIQTILGGSKSGIAGLEVMGGFFNQLKDNTNAAAAALRKGGKDVENWDVIQSNFNVQLEAGKNAVTALLITIGTQMLPVLSKLLAQVTPLIAEFTQWLVKSGALQSMASSLANGLLFVVQAISQMVTIGVAVVNFFQQNQWAGDALIAILAGVAAGMIFMALTALPPLIASLLMWGGVAIAVGIANVIAFWPILAVIAAVAIAVFLVILVVRNWGAIAHWLVGAWHAAISWLTGALHSIGAFFVSVWNWIKSATMAAWNFLVEIVKAGAHFLYLVIFGPFIAIGALFRWLYNHNTYFKMLIDTIVNIVKAGVAWLVGAWHTAVSWIVERWTYLKLMAEMYFMLLYVTIEIKILQVEAFIRSVWNRVISFLKGIWDTLVRGFQIIWQQISNIFSSAWSNYVARPLNNLWNSILGFVNGWPKQAVQWGINLIKGFISGILSMLGGVGNAAGQIIGKVTSFLGFHSPAKEGEGQHLLEWPRNMVKSYADELAAQTPYLQAKVSMLVAPLAIMSHAVPLTGRSSTPLTSAPTNGAGTTINVIVNAPARTQDEAQEIAEAVSQKLSRMWRGQGTLAGGLFS